MICFHQIIYTDVALDPYSSDGHDGIVREDGEADFLVYDGSVCLFGEKLVVSTLSLFSNNYNVILNSRLQFVHVNALLKIVYFLRYRDVDPNLNLIHCRSNIE